jgi:hypothetical protein
MYLNMPRGLGHVPSYQSSAVPYLTSSLIVPGTNNEPIEVSFPNVTRFIIITNTYDGDQNIPLRFGFSANGIKGVENNNYAILNNGESFEADFRVSKVFLLSDSVFSTSGSIVAGLTDIKENLLPNNWTGSAGIG